MERDKALDKQYLKLLEEAKRVTKDRIIVFEDTFSSYFDKFFLCFWDVLANLPGFLVKPFGEKMPFNFKRVSEWEKIFKKFQLKIIFQKEFKSNKLIHQRFFVIQKK